MAQYFLHVHNGTGFTRDEEGQDFADLTAARIGAIDGIRSILSEEVRSGALDLAGQVEVTDAAGHIALTLPFEEAVEIHRRSTTIEESL
ncbi:DUF6894 family protein [Sphingomonas hengshuiensis]|uniref:DUF6894 domain-containing protein n=1 Tax=Sphingomonas hengshuiensis TaxID=1609977 RepID=A0A7U4J8Q6_9SPHN|nr:hypothetical protein [Sphingomonas hengshuiensis]AJP72318.1 hypothetical protein TS85_11770 [Sphingomonas hengshuiensis]